MSVERSSGNVFLDIGFDEIEAEELAAKANLLTLVAKSIRLRGLTQATAARICGTHQTSISQALSGKLESITLDRLTRWIVALGGNVQITVSQPTYKAKSTQRGSLSIHAQ